MESAQSSDDRFDRVGVRCVRLRGEPNCFQLLKLYCDVVVECRESSWGCECSRRIERPGERRGLTADVPSDSADEIAGWLGPDTLGVECAPLSGGRTSLRVYFEQESDAGDVRAALATALRAAGLSHADVPVRLEAIWAVIAASG